MKLQLHLRKQVLYHRVPPTFFPDPFTTRICAYILMLPKFCSCAVAFLQKFVHALSRISKNLSTWAILQRARLF